MSFTVRKIFRNRHIPFFQVIANVLTLRDILIIYEDLDINSETVSKTGSMARPPARDAFISIYICMYVCDFDLFRCCFVMSLHKSMTCLCQCYQSVSQVQFILPINYCSCNIAQNICIPLIQRYMYVCVLKIIPTTNNWSKFSS